MSIVVRRLVSATAAMAAIAAGISLGRYHREMRETRRRVRAGGRIAETARGPIEYGVAGAGLPVLLVHGAAGGYDQGLLLARTFAPAGVQVIAPSRFGYLKTPLPEDASPAAQADAHAALLDSLGIDRAVVVGVSAGAPSAVELALRHPQRVRGMVLAVPRGYAPNTAALPLGRGTILWLRFLLSSDLVYWSARRISGDRLVRRMGSPPDLLSRASAAERERVLAMLQGVLPVGGRRAGLKNDVATRLTPLPLETIDQPTLIVTARDDPLDTLPAAEFMAKGIAGARLIVVDNGGHLLVNRGREVTKAIGEFLADLQTNERAPSSATPA